MELAHSVDTRAPSQAINLHPYAIFPTHIRRNSSDFHVRQINKNRVAHTRFWSIFNSSLLVS